MNTRIYEFDALIQKVPEIDGAYIEFPYNIRVEFGKGRVKVQAAFDGEPYNGSLVNMGVKNQNGSVCYILGIPKAIRAKIGKHPGDTVKVTLKEDKKERDVIMWQCEKCGRTFKNTDQHHFCGEIKTIDQYISEQPEEVRPILQKICEIIRLAAPNAKEKISWRMPTFWQGENLIHFAAAKKHIGIYPGGEATTIFADRLTDYKTSKGTIQLPLNRPIPYDLISEITKWRVQSVENKT